GGLDVQLVAGAEQVLDLAAAERAGQAQVVVAVGAVLAVDAWIHGATFPAGVWRSRGPMGRLALLVYDEGDKGGVRAVLARRRRRCRVRRRCGGWSPSGTWSGSRRSTRGSRPPTSPADRHAARSTLRRPASPAGCRSRRIEPLASRSTWPEDLARSRPAG